MGRNILIFVDGTGNEGGLLPDESRTNVYKLFRATRTGPDSLIEPTKQIAFYIPGVGTSLPGSNSSLRQRIRNVIQQATGRGVTKRIIEGYAAIISVWEPGDRIYLFGFSRGAYIARCVANLLDTVGVPTKDRDKPLSFEPSALNRVAAEAVRTRYRGGLPRRNMKAREVSAENFRKRYVSAVGGEPIGALPFFIGVWDTVAAIGWNHLLVAWVIKMITRSEHPYDLHFPKDVPYARHAMAIDEYRIDFVRVPWGGSGTVSYDDLEGLQRFDQVWFAGNHSDIGGSYPENESRLSDISLHWMADLITTKLPERARVLIQPELLQCFPSADGMMHDELMAGVGSHHLRIFVRGDRRVDPGGTLHSTVIERLEMQSVRNYVGFGPYRPASLQDHPAARKYYPAPRRDAQS